MEKKICCRCKQEKIIDDFHKLRSSKDGHGRQCKSCSASQYLKKREHAIKVSRQWYANNKERKSITSKQWRESHKEQSQDYERKLYKDNIEYHSRRQKKYYDANKAKINKRTMNNARKRLKEDIVFYLAHVLRCRLRLAVKNEQRAGSAVRDLGCSIEELKVHLENKFQEDMTWGNYGLRGWHIDHIIPLSSFDLTDPEQLKKACHYTNLQPLWAKDNLVKSNKIINNEDKNNE